MIPYNMDLLNFYFSILFVKRTKSVQDKFKYEKICGKQFKKEWKKEGKLKKEKRKEKEGEKSFVCWWKKVNCLGV